MVDDLTHDCAASSMEDDSEEDSGLSEFDVSASEADTTENGAPTNTTGK